jgi:hypothetical protein
MVIAMMTTTAIPRPVAVFTFFETAKKVHIPKKNAKARFSINTDRKKMLRYSSTR